METASPSPRLRSWRPAFRMPHLRVPSTRGVLSKSLTAVFAISTFYVCAADPNFRSVKGVVAAPLVGLGTAAGLVVGTAKGGVIGGFTGAANNGVTGAVAGVFKGAVDGAVNGAQQGYGNMRWDMSVFVEAKPKPTPKERKPDPKKKI